jgi:hypothetical protein
MHTEKWQRTLLEIEVGHTTRVVLETVCKVSSTMYQRRQTTKIEILIGLLHAKRLYRLIQCNPNGGTVYDDMVSLPVWLCVESPWRPIRNCSRILHSLPRSNPFFIFDIFHNDGTKHEQPFEESSDLATYRMSYPCYLPLTVRHISVCQTRVIGPSADNGIMHECVLNTCSQSLT